MTTRQWTIRANERVLLVGKTGSGKTYLARRLARDLQRLVVLDSKGTLRGNFDTSEWSDKGLKALLRGEAVRLRAAVPPGMDTALYWDQIFQWCYEAGNIVIYVDEVYGISPPGTKPSAWLTAVWTRGREQQVGVWASTQRPSWIPLFLLSESDWFAVFRLQIESDRERMGSINSDLSQPVRDAHGFWLYHASWERARYVPRIRLT